MENQTYYYARTSSKGKDLDRQIAAFRIFHAQAREIFTDDELFSDAARPGYRTLKETLRPGDTLIVKSLDRLTRSIQDLPQELRYFQENGICLKIIELPTTMVDFPPEHTWASAMMLRLLIETLEIIIAQAGIPDHSQQLPELDATKQQRKKPGRPALSFPKNWERVYTAWKSGEITAKTAMEQTGTKRTSFYKLVHMTENKSI